MADQYNTDGSMPWIPSRPIRSDYTDLELEDRVRQLSARTLPVTIPIAPINPTGRNGIPKALLTVTATQEPTKQQDRTYSAVFVSFTRDTSDQNYQGVNVWFEGYQGSSTPQLMVSGFDSPVKFLCEATKETVTVFVQPIGASGASARLDFAISTTVTLSGVISAPPAPSVSQTLAGTGTGYQFSFNQVNLGGTQDVVDSYRIYRNTSNTTAGASLIQTIKHSPTNTGAVVVTDTIMAATGANYFYWVSAVNTSGLESTLTAAQAGTVPGSAGTIPPSLNSNMTYTSDASSITWSWTGLAILRADGTTTSVSNSSRTTSSLAATTTYYFYPYWDEATQTLLWVNGSGNGNTGEAFTAAQRDNGPAQQQGLRNRVALSVGPISGATTAGGPPGGGSGGGSGRCVRSTMFVQERTKGIVQAKQIRAGDYLWTPAGWSRVEVAQELPANLFIRIGVQDSFIEVVPSHPFTAMDEASNPIESIRACELTFLHQLHTRDGAGFVDYMRLIRDSQGTKMLITLSDTCHTFYAGEGYPRILAHNVMLDC